MHTSTIFTERKTPETFPPPGRNRTPLLSAHATSSIIQPAHQSHSHIFSPPPKQPSHPHSNETKTNLNSHPLIKHNRRIPHINILREQLIRNAILLHDVIKSPRPRDDGPEQEPEDPIHHRINKLANYPVTLSPLPPSSSSSLSLPLLPSHLFYFNFTSSLPRPLPIPPLILSPPLLKREVNSPSPKCPNRPPHGHRRRDRFQPTRRYVK